MRLRGQHLRYLHVLRMREQRVFFLKSGENTFSRAKPRCSRLTVGWVRCSLLIYVRLETWPATVFPPILGVVVPVLVGVLVVLLGAFLLLCSFVFLVDNVF